MVNGSLTGNYVDSQGPKYPGYLPVWSKTKFPDWKEVPFVDRGLFATPDKRNLLTPGTYHRQLTPALGEEIWVSCRYKDGDPD